MKLDAVFFNIIPRVNRNAVRSGLQLAFASGSCQYAASRQNISSAVLSEKHDTKHRKAESDVASAVTQTLFSHSPVVFQCLHQTLSSFLCHDAPC